MITHIGVQKVFSSSFDRHKACLSCGHVTAETGRQEIKPRSSVLLGKKDYDNRECKKNSYRSKRLYAEVLLATQSLEASQTIYK